MERSFEITLKSRSKDDDLSVVINEVVDADYGLYVWPSAPLLAQFMMYHKDRIAGKRVLELGAGTAMAGIVAAKLGARVTLSDGSQFSRSLANCRQVSVLNKLSNVDVVHLTWGDYDRVFLQLEPMDIIIASDCFYNTNDFEDIIATVSLLFEKNPDAEFWTTYQERSRDRCIEHLLKKWGMTGKQIPLHEFEADASLVSGLRSPPPHCIRLFVISKEV